MTGLLRNCRRLSISSSEDLDSARAALIRRLLAMVSGAGMDATRQIQELEALASDAERLADETEFAFLWNPRRKLMSIGMETEKGEVHSACYDLLASEARTAAFIAVAKDEVPQETWFLLARTHIAPLGHPVLLSWTGTMFEYLMPALWMRTYPGTLLDRSRQAAVEIAAGVHRIQANPLGNFGIGVRSPRRRGHLSVSRIRHSATGFAPRRCGCARDLAILDRACTHYSPEASSRQSCGACLTRAGSDLRIL